jgi:hypothetical protein
MPESKWQQLRQWLMRMDKHVPAVFPSELPAESDPTFWFEVARLEMSGRVELSRKVTSLINISQSPEFSDLEAWFYRRRVEWASQLILVKLDEGVEPDAKLEEILEWALVKTWETDGCIALWNHAERGGKPHADNPDGLSPIPTR